MAFVRGANPIWYLVDLTANAFDDKYYMFVLQNQIPYLPATVYHDADGTIPWNNPIQFLANGTLPTDIYFDSDITYRLEFRKGNTQNDALIYSIENYTASGGGGDTPTSVDLSTENQITNPQFSITNFPSPYTLSGISTQDIEIAPGWVLELEGTGNVTLEKTPLNGQGASATPTNAPYALRINVNGAWTSVVLRQRFDQNGTQWANTTVSTALTARIEGATDTINVVLNDSSGATLGSFFSETVDSTFNEYTGSITLPDSSNTDVPPDAYLEYRVILPSNVDIYLTSFQIINSGIDDFEPSYEQETIERQVDHTFHYYRDSILRESKDSLLTGWDFGLNPWQAYATSTTNVSTFGYTADQTIINQQAYIASTTNDNISTERGSAAENYGFKVTAVSGTNQFAIIQYIAPSTIRNEWGSILSSLVKLNASLKTDVNMKMRLIYRSSLPPSLSQNEPIVSWGDGLTPVFASGWTAIEPENDVSYLLENGENTLYFEKFALPASDDDNMTLGVVLYTTDDMDESGTADSIIFNEVSLTPTEFAIAPNKLSFDETLRRCQFYYEKSYAPETQPGATTFKNSKIVMQTDEFLDGTTNPHHFYRSTLFFDFTTTKHREPATSDITFYDATTGTANRVNYIIYNGTATPAVAPAGNPVVDNINNWDETSTRLSKDRLNYLTTATTPIRQGSSHSPAYYPVLVFHYVIDIRLGN